MIVLDKWQKEILDYHGDMLLCAGRRVGKTYILARKAIERMIEKKIDIIIFSLTEEQSMIILSMAQNYAQIRCPGLVSKKKIDTNKKTLTLKNGSKMKCRPAGDTGDSGRGFDGGIVVVDEAARMGKLFWISILPIILMKAGEVWISSTPFGKQGYFWDRFNEAYNLKDPEARYKVFYVTTEEVIRDRELTEEWTEAHRERVQKILAQDRKTMTNSEYGQEYLGLFLDDLQRLFSDELIEECCTLKRSPNLIGKKYLGMDIAGLGKDISSFEILCKINDDDIRQIEHQTMSKAYSSQVSDRAAALAKDYDVRKIGVDDGGIGFGVYSNLLQNQKTKKKTIALNNSSRSTDSKDEKHKKILKDEMYFRLLSYMESKKIKLLDDGDLKLSLTSIQWELITKDEGLTKTRIFGKDSHIVEGIIRALWLASEDKTLNIWCR